MIIDELIQDFKAKEILVDIPYEVKGLHMVRQKHYKKKPLTKVDKCTKIVNKVRQKYNIMEESIWKSYS